MARHKSRAFVLSAADYRETSKLLQLFCEKEGRISVIARGLRSPKARKAQLADGFNLLQVNYTLKDGATLGMLTGLEPERLYSGLRQNLEAYALASYWFEIIKVAAQSRIAGDEVFRLTDEFLQSLECGGLSRDGVQLLLDFAQELGFGLQLFACGSCGAREGLRRFSIGAGATYCQNCTPPPGRVLIVPEGQLENIRNAKTDLSRAASGAFLKLLNEFLSTHLDHRFATFGFVGQVVIE
jgi:DNA repair protein RecO (recombination protein O)